MARTKTQNILRYTIFAVAGSLAFALLSYVLIIRPLQIRNQKLQFQKAEASLDVLAIQIEQIIGKPNQSKKEKSCDRANLLSEKGPLNCSVSLYVLYEGSSAEQATEYMRKISKLGTSSIRIGSGSTKGDAFINIGQLRGEQKFYQSFGSINSLSCSFNYTYPAIDHEKFIPQKSTNLQVGMNCGGPALSELFH